MLNTIDDATLARTGGGGGAILMIANVIGAGGLAAYASNKVHAIYTNIKAKEAVDAEIDSAKQLTKAYREENKKRNGG